MKKSILILLALISVDTLAGTTCMAEAIYWEARGESLTGQLAVAGVVLNRVRSKKYPNSICRVIQQRKQFSWSGNKSRTVSEKEAWNNSLKLSNKILRKEIVISSKFTATHFHSITTDPKWGLEFHAQIGNHIFYFEE